MKKIMFNDKYRLTQAVLEGRKTQTRRIIPLSHKMDFSGFGIDEKGKIYATFVDAEGRKEDAYPKYQIGEEVAIAQSYRNGGSSAFWLIGSKGDGLTVISSHGWSNKMFVRADLMPHLIKITNVRVERLHDISNEDCMKEGIMRGEFINTWDEYYFEHGCNNITAKTARDAFKKLIDKVSGKGTWESNPYVYVYGFELVK